MSPARFDITETLHSHVILGPNPDQEVSLWHWEGNFSFRFIPHLIVLNIKWISTHNIVPGDDWIAGWCSVLLTFMLEDIMNHLLKRIFCDTKPKGPLKGRHL